MARVADASGNSPRGPAPDYAVGQSYDLQVVRPESEQVIAYTGTAGNSTPFDASYQQIRIVATSNCHYRIGAGVTALVTDNYLPLGVIEYVKVRPGDRISVIQNSAGGNLHVAKVY